MNNRQQNSLAELERDLGDEPRPSHEEEVALSRRFRAGDRAAGEELWRRHGYMALRMARRKARGSELLDFSQAALIGLWHAVEAFDPERGFRLVTYAKHKILREMQLVVHAGRIIRTPHARPARPAPVRIAAIRYADLPPDTDQVVEPETSCDPAAAAELAERCDRVRQSLSTLAPEVGRLVSNHYGIGDAGEESGPAHSKVRNTVLRRVERSITRLRRCAALAPYAHEGTTP